MKILFTDGRISSCESDINIGDLVSLNENFDGGIYPRYEGAFKYFFHMEEPYTVKKEEKKFLRMHPWRVVNMAVHPYSSLSAVMFLVHIRSHDGKNLVINKTYLTPYKTKHKRDDYYKNVMIYQLQGNDFEVKCHSHREKLFKIYEKNY